MQAICANLFVQIAWRLLQTVQACGASLQVAQATVWIFLTPSWNTLLLNFFYITYFFSTFRYFSLYLFSNLAFCSFFLFLLLHSVLVTHHSAGSDLYSSINSIKNCYSSAVPFGRHSEINPITNNDSWHNHMVSTPSNTEVCLCKQTLRRRKHWLLAQKISNCFDFTQAACASTQTTPYTVKQFAQTLCLHKLLARVGAA